MEFNRFCRNLIDKGLYDFDFDVKFTAATRKRYRIATGVRLGERMKSPWRWTRFRSRGARIVRHVSKYRYSFAESPGALHECTHQCK